MYETINTNIVRVGIIQHKFTLGDPVSILREEMTVIYGMQLGRSASILSLTQNIHEGKSSHFASRWVTQLTVNVPRLVSTAVATFLFLLLLFGLLGRRLLGDHRFLQGRTADGHHGSVHPDDCRLLVPRVHHPHAIHRLRWVHQPLRRAVAIHGQSHHVAPRRLIVRNTVYGSITDTVFILLLFLFPVDFVRII